MGFRLPGPDAGGLSMCGAIGTARLMFAAGTRIF